MKRPADDRAAQIREAVAEIALALDVLHANSGHRSPALARARAASAALYQLVHHGGRP